MPFNEEFLSKWEHLIEEVNKTEVTIECLKKIIIRLSGKKQRTINLALLRKQGLDEDEIEAVLTRTLASFGNEVRDVDFVVDVVAVAELVQPATDKLLNGL